MTPGSPDNHGANHGQLTTRRFAPQPQEKMELVQYITYTFPIWFVGNMSF